MENEVVNELRQQLMDNADEEYRAFVAKTIRLVPNEKIIGVRAPILQQIVREVEPTRAMEFRAALPHEYHEENLMHAYMIAAYDRADDYPLCLKELGKFLPYVDNWGVCDVLVPKVFGRHPSGLEEQILDWLRADRPYTIRFGLLTLMKYYLDEYFDEEHFQWVIDVSSNEYYVQMGAAWYFATALVKRYDQTVPLLEHRMLEPEVHALTLQKAVQSSRVPYERKKYLRTLK